ncbi:MAG: PPK2 family polyphosphate:nucleotide phosphotransferase [Limisphaerales bacterium]
MSHAHKIKDFNTRAPKSMDKNDTKKEIEALQERMPELQRLMGAQGKHSLLIVLQGMDASGKDGASSSILQGFTSGDVEIESFKKPTEEEFAHDFLWRVHEVVPQKGGITIFNRSHYEDVLIQRVHNWIDEDRVKQRFEHINNFEQLLAQENGTTILKFFLNVSFDKQEERLTERKEILRKMHKHNDGDWEERKHWSKYMEAYEDVFANCGPEIPWIIVPTDQNWMKEYTLIKTIVDTMEGWGMEYPGAED